MWFMVLMRCVPLLCAWGIDSPPAAGDGAPDARAHCESPVQLGAREASPALDL